MAASASTLILAKRYNYDRDLNIYLYYIYGDLSQQICHVALRWRLRCDILWKYVLFNDFQKLISLLTGLPQYIFLLSVYVVFIITHIPLCYHSSVLLHIRFTCQCQLRGGWTKRRLSATTHNGACLFSYPTPENNTHTQVILPYYQPLRIINGIMGHYVHWSHIGCWVLEVENNTIISSYNLASEMSTRICIYLFSNRAL